MSKRAEAAAMEALPDYSPDGKTKVDLTLDRLLYQHGYEQAEKDLALTWQDVSIIITIYEAGIDSGDYRRYNDAEWMKEYSQDILRKFNEIGKK